MSKDDPCELYRHHCARVGSASSTAVLRGLATASPTLQACGDEAVFPLLTLLRAGGAPHVRSLKLGGRALSSETISQLAGLLREQRSCGACVETLQLHKVRLDGAGFAELILALRDAGEKSPLRELMMRGNVLSCAAGMALAEALSASGQNGGVSALTRLDVSNNNLEHCGVVAIEKAVKYKEGFELVIDGNLIVVEILNSITHGVGVVASIGAGAVLAYRAYGVLEMYQLLAILLFCASLCTMFFSSCMYHSLFRYPPLRDVMHSCDLCSVFVLIAGSYTPFLVFYTFDPMTVSGPIALTLVWFCAIVGVLMGLNVIRAASVTRAYFALAMGWSGIFPLRTIFERMEPEIMVLVFAGGIAYSAGVYWYIGGRRKPMMHVVWHLAVLLGGGLHYAALWRHVSLRQAVSVAISG
jgi:hemolysin III